MLTPIEAEQCIYQAHDVAALTDTSYAEAEGVLLAVLDKQAYSVLHG